METSKNMGYKWAVKKMDNMPTNRQALEYKATKTNNHYNNKWIIFTMHVQQMGNCYNMGALTITLKYI